MIIKGVKLMLITLILPRTLFKILTVMMKEVRVIRQVSVAVVVTEVFADQGAAEVVGVGVKIGEGGPIIKRIRLPRK
jgi:hypothetical protein